MTILYYNVLSFYTFPHNNEEKLLKELLTFYSCDNIFVILQKVINIINNPLKNQYCPQMYDIFPIRTRQNKLYALVK